MNLILSGWDIYCREEQGRTDQLLRHHSVRSSNRYTVLYSTHKQYHFPQIPFNKFLKFFHFVMFLLIVLTELQYNRS
jgi:hypothetical protein